ncbi:MAG: hypothetical protein NT041_00845 [Candidatus Vogelbacteria bacterium]|nr:hypothetical protein [Candidatus Vogelbacteria bacterium]
MTHFNRRPEFSQEFKRLSKKYRSLEQDMSDLEDVLKTWPIGSGKNFTVIHNDEEVKIVKARLMCKTLRNRNIRIIYAHHDNTFEFMYLEIYFKGDKANEDRERIRNYLKNQG